MRKTIVCAGLVWALVVACSCGSALAQERYPARPVRIIVAIAAGSLTDIILRKAAQEVGGGFGQPLIIDNRPGANTVVGAELCARAAPDGYTYCVVNRDTTSVIPHIVSKLSYDPAKDFKPVTRLYDVVQGLVTTVSLPVDSVRELQALAVAKPDAYNFGTFGAGSNPDVARQWLNDTWKTNIIGVPYKGANLIMNALASGEIHLTRISLGSAGGLVRAGKLKVIALGSSKRSRLFPNAPTYAEAGLEGFPEGIWWGIVAPAGTPDAMVRRVNQEFVRLFREPKFAEFLENESLESAVSSPEEFAAFLRDDRERGAATVRRFNIPRE